jgi:hypothetical protein
MGMGEMKETKSHVIVIVETVDTGEQISTLSTMDCGFRITRSEQI